MAQHIDKYLDSMKSKSLGENPLDIKERWSQFGNLVNKIHNDYGGDTPTVSKEVGKYAFDKFMDHYGKHEEKVGWSDVPRHKSVNLNNVPKEYFTDEHIQKLHDFVPLTLHAPFEVHEKLHEKRLGKIEDMTHDLLKGEENEEPDEVLSHKAGELEKQHIAFANEMENHLENKHMEYETGYGEEDDHLNKVPSIDHVERLHELNDKADELEAEAYHNSDHYGNRHTHDDNRDELNTRKGAIDDYENRYYNW